MGNVYLLADHGKDGFYKIGVTRGSIEKRIKKLQTGNSGEIYLVDYFQTEHPFFIEKYLHLAFFKDNVKNEWFKLNLEQITNFKSYCEKGEKLFNDSLENPFFKNRR